jgi:hypothetical protein
VTPLLWYLYSVFITYHYNEYLKKQPKRRIIYFGSYFQSAKSIFLDSIDSGSMKHNIVARDQIKGDILFMADRKQRARKESGICITFKIPPPPNFFLQISPTS